MTPGNESGLVVHTTSPSHSVDSSILPSPRLSFPPPSHLSPSSLPLETDDDPYIPVPENLVYSKEALLALSKCKAARYCPPTLDPLILRGAPGNLTDQKYHEKQTHNIKSYPPKDFSVQTRQFDRQFRLNRDHDLSQDHNHHHVYYDNFNGHYHPYHDDHDDDHPDCPDQDYDSDNQDDDNHHYYNDDHPNNQHDDQNNDHTNKGHHHHDITHEHNHNNTRLEKDFDIERFVLTSPDSDSTYPNDTLGHSSKVTFYI
jgi:hypothetical protein